MTVLETIAFVLVALVIGVLIGVWWTGHSLDRACARVIGY